jgi:hypothetical protein
MDSYFEEQPVQPYGVMPPQFKDDKESPEIGVIRELSPKRVLEQLRMNLKGFYYDYDLKKYVFVTGFEPLMNERGIAKYLSIMGSVITDLVTFSSYSQEEIPQLVLYVCDKALPVIHINYKEYGIKEKSDLEIIDIQIFNLTLAAFKKAVGAGDRGVIGRTIQESIVSRSGMMNPVRGEEKQGGFLHRINPFAR